VQVCDSQGGSEFYDQVVMASHGDEALALLEDADGAERAALSPFRYQKNVAVLHRDTGLMPRRQRCWASWVYNSDGDFQRPKIGVTYWMNRLQGIDPSRPLFVSLNPVRPIADKLVFDTATFDHPVFDAEAIAAQGKVAQLQGRRGIWFTGAHLGHGFHEDGLASAVTVARALGATIPWNVSGDPSGSASAAAQQNAQGGRVPDFQNPLPAELF
jgi:predicted NAD/FAD-binding protein